MNQLRSKTVITTGFVTILILLFIVIGLWINDVHKARQRLAKIVQEDSQRELVSVMRDATLKRVNTLLRMIKLEDPFERDEQFLKFREHGSRFVDAREKLLATEKTPTEKVLWEKTRTILQQGGPAQRQVTNLAQQDELDAATKILFEKVEPKNEEFVKTITDIFNYKRKLIDEELKQATHENETTYTLISLLMSITLLFVFFNIFIVRRTSRTEEALMEQGERIRSMYEVTAMTGSQEEQLTEMLKLGCRFLKMNVGKICQISEEHNTNKVIKVLSETNNTLKDGAVFPLNETFCQYVYPSEEPIAINNIGQSEYKDSDSYLNNNVESYIAAPIWIKGKKYGTVAFINTKARADDFTATDKDIVNLIGSWISVTLEREFSEIELRRAMESAEAANKSKSKFLANMSHELRTPLNAIIGYSDLLSEEMAGYAQSRHLVDVERIASSGHHLLSLINNILDIAKIESGKMEVFKEELEVLMLCEEMRIIFEPLCMKNNNKLNINVANNLGIVSLDKTKLKQILINLLSNANKFTKDGTLSLDVQKAELDDTQCLKIVVSDTGIGMSGEQIDKVFLEFDQGDISTSSQYGGTGLGLPICRYMCQLLGGEIRVQSEVGVGSRFTVLIPITENVESEIPETESKAG
ncbi:GAF domain-containing sensor histidine kinase [Kaarinaea lacus]